MGISEPTPCKKDTFKWVFTQLRNLSPTARPCAQKPSVAFSPWSQIHFHVRTKRHRLPSEKKWTRKHVSHACLQRCSHDTTAVTGISLRMKSPPEEFNKTKHDQHISGTFYRRSSSTKFKFQPSQRQRSPFFPPKYWALQVVRHGNVAIIVINRGGKYGTWTESK